MKNKPQKHKAANSFKHKSFADRVAEIDVRKAILYHIDYQYEEDLGENESYFAAAVTKWRALNLTDEYEVFHKGVREIVTLPQLLHRKDFVIQHLLDCLERATHLSLQPLLEFVAILAKELQSDFCEVLPKFLERLLQLLHSTDAEVVEWTLICLAYLFKHLKRHLKKDIEIVLNLILPILKETVKEHIQNFAIECFAYVARDIRDRERCISAVVEFVKLHDGITVSCSRLLFQMIRGAAGGLHSCTEEFLTVLLDALHTRQEDQFIIYGLLTEMIACFKGVVTRDSTEVLWRVFMKHLRRIMALEETPASSKLFIDLLQSLSRGYPDIFLKNPQELCQGVEKLLERDIEDFSFSLILLVETLLTGRHITLSLHEATNLVRAVFLTKHFSIVNSFVTATVKTAQFDSLILPHFLDAILRFGMSEQVLELLTLVVQMKSPLSRDGLTLAEWKSYPLPLKCEDFEKFLLEDSTFCPALICWTHLVDQGDMEGRLIEQLKVIEDFNKYSLILRALIHRKSDQIDALDAIKRIIGILDTPWRDYEEKLPNLWLLDLCVTSVKMKDASKLTFELFEDLHKRLSALLSSPSHQIRLMASHTLAQFNHLEDLSSSEPFLFDVIFSVENTSPSIHTYRGQLLELQKFSFDTVFFRESLKHEILKWDALKYLLGVLYINFKLLWAPTIDYIATYAANCDRKVFWNIYKEQLESIEGHLRQEVSETRDFIHDIHPVWSFMSSSETQRLGKDPRDKPDFVNYRILLWKALPQFGGLVQEKNRDLVSFFLDFYEKVYKLYILEHSNRKIDLRVPGEIPSDTEEVESEEAEEEVEKLNPQITKAIHKELITYLQVFSSISNPKILFREGEMHEIYLQLLSSRNPIVQKTALDCLFTYKSKIQRHKEILYDFVDEKKFRDAMRSFVIRQEQKEQELSLVAEDRPHVMDYLLRILHGKMFTRQQKGEPQTRKLMIIRYLSGCTAEELNKFLDLIFKPASETYYELMDVDLSSSTHPRHLQGSLAMLDIMISEFGGVRDGEILKRLLHLLMDFSVTVRGILKEAEERPVRYQNLLKSLRSDALNMLRKFFNLFDAYPWSEDEIENMFMIFIWPQMIKLRVECIHSPTPLLRLLLAWSTHPRYFVLLSKGYDGGEGDMNPLSSVFELLQTPRINAKVTDAVMEIISNLLTLDGESMIQEGEKGPEIIVRDSQIPSIEVGDNISLGRRMMLPHIDDIIDRLKSRMSGFRKGKSLGKRDLSILSRITDFVTDREQCETLVGLLLPILTKKTSRMINESAMVQMISSLTNLMDKSDSPGRHIRTLAPLFGEISSVACRKLLCDLMVRICERSGELKIAKLVVELNALNKRWIDQPDYDRRLGAFQQIDDLKDLDLNIGLMAIFHAYFYLKHEKDLAMRSSASHCLKKVILLLARKLSAEPQERRYVFDGVVLPLIKSSLAGGNEDLRSECVRILGDLSREHPEVHYVFGDLQPLTDKLDKEVDFFENIIHLQSHRQGKALMRLIKRGREMNDPNPKTLMDFLLPLVSRYLGSEDHTKNSLVDFAAEAISVICSKLPFIPYQTILRLYIRKLRTSLEFQKQMVKVVIAIIDAFHFDFSKMQKTLDTPQEAEESEEEEDGDLEEVRKESKKILKEKTPTTPEYNLMVGLISSLIGAMSELSAKEASHKLTKSQNAAQEAEDILRVPIAVATVQLLHKVSKELLDAHLPKIFMKLCTFLKSRLKSVRIVTRDMLRRIMTILGPGYLSVLLDLLTSLFTRGYQVHVLVVTLHNILDTLKGNFRVGDVDKNLQGLLKVCLENVFGESAEEREVEKIASKTPEAKFSNKSLLILHILASNISEKCLLDLLVPFKDHLSRSHSKKVVNKVQDCLSKIVIGLGENKRISTESLLMFTFGVVTESIDTLKMRVAKKPITEVDKELLKRKPSDIFLIPNEKTASRRNVVKTNVQTNTHVLTEFGLNLLHAILKSGRADSSQFDGFLNPLVKIFRETLGGVHVRLSTLTLKCLTVVWTRQLMQEAMKGEIVEEFVEKVLEILKRYSSTELNNNEENFHLVKNTFKAIMALMRFVESFTVSEDQLREILLHVDRDLHARQAIAFPLLRAIVSKKLYVEEIDKIIEFVAELSVTSENDSVREEARQILITYLLDYPMDGGKFKQHLMFFLSQLTYTESTGRSSVVKLMDKLMRKLSKKILKKNCGVIFLALGARFVEDELPEVREEIAKCLEGVLRRLDDESRRELWEIVLSLFKDDKSAHAEMGAILTVRFLVAEGEAFRKRLDNLLPLMVGRLIGQEGENLPGRFVRAQVDETESASDHKLIQILIALGRIFERFPGVLKEEKLAKILDGLAFKCQEFLAYEHSWVRYFSAKILSHVLSEIDGELLARRLAQPDEEELVREFIYRNPASHIRSLTLDLCAQLQPEHIQENMAEEIMKILLILAKFIRLIPLVKKERDLDEEDLKPDKRINLLWMVHRLRYAANGEVTQTPHSTILRSSIFQWIQGVVHMVDPSTLRLLIRSLLTPLVREMSTEMNNHDPALAQLATKITEKIKKKVNSDEFTSLVNEIQLKQMQKRAERKKIIALDKVVNPAKAAKRKASQQERKKVAKRRKMDVIKGKVAPKKRKVPTNVETSVKMKRKKVK